MVVPGEKCVLGSRIFRDLAHSYEFAVTLFIGKLISLIFVTATFVVYMMTPRLMDRRGSMLSGYLTSYVGSVLVFSCSLASIKYLDENCSCSLLVIIGLWYFLIASMCWLNVMCVENWKTFLIRESDQDIKVNDHPDSHHNDYSKYAWGGPTFCVLLMVGFTLASNSNDTVKFHFLTTSVVLPAAMITMCNTSLFILTGISIKKHENGTKELLDHANQLHRENKQWFYSCVQLFLLMKLPLILVAAGIYWQNLAVFTFGSALEALQGYLIFRTFVFKRIRHDSDDRGRTVHISGDSTDESLILSNSTKKNGNLVEKKVKRKKRSRTIIKTVEKIIKKKVLRNH